LLLVGLVSPLAAQSNWSLSVQSGAELGWWVYDKGFNDSLPDFHQGFDRTHLSFVLPLEISLHWQNQRWQYGLGLQYRVLFDDVLIGSDHRRSSRNQYNISRNGSEVGFVQWHAQLAWQALQQGRYQFWPWLRVGGFRPFAVHPREDYYRFFLHYTLALENRVQMGEKWALQFMPRYTEKTILTRSDAFRGEQHKVYTIGIMLGVCCYL
jgi:hypothetical protein